MNQSTSREIVVKQSEVKHINATATQIQSYHIYKAQGKDVNERKFILSVLQSLGVPCSRRYIQELTGLPINHLTRIFYDLKNRGLVTASNTDICQFTGRRVIHYSATKREGNEAK